MELGQLVATRGIDSLMIENEQFRKDVYMALNKYVKHNWGVTCQEDAKMNDEAVINGERILAVYNSCKGRIWIITEWDRSVTNYTVP